MLTSRTCSRPPRRPPVISAVTLMPPLDSVASPAGGVEARSSA
jgi:hypothetical protein